MHNVTRRHFLQIVAATVPVAMGIVKVTARTVGSAVLDKLPWGGRISEIMVFDRALMANEIAVVENYLTGKYALGDIVSEFSAKYVDGEWSPFDDGPEPDEEWTVFCAMGSTQVSPDKPWVAGPLDDNLVSWYQGLGVPEGGHWYTSDSYDEEAGIWYNKLGPYDELYQADMDNPLRVIGEDVANG